MSLLYGAGIRLDEALSLRIKDIDLPRRTVNVRAGKGAKDRRTVLPEAMVEPLRLRIEASRQLHLRDTLTGAGYVPLPMALAVKIPSALRDWRWSWVFPASRTFTDRRTGHRMRFHVHATTAQRAIAVAVAASGLNKRVTALTFRPFVTPSPRICCVPAMTSAPCRSCWVIGTSRPRWSTCTSWTGEAVCAARSTPSPRRETRLPSRRLLSDGYCDSSHASPHYPLFMHATQGP